MEYSGVVKKENSIYESDFNLLYEVFSKSRLEIGKRNFLVFLCLISALLDRHNTYIIKEIDAYNRKVIPSLLLDLFPSNYILEFHDWGIVNFLSHNLEGKKIAYIANFNSRTNRKLIQLISSNQRPISYTKDNFDFIIPQITILTTTNKDITDKSLRKNTFIINTFQEKLQFNNNIESSLKYRIQKFILNLDTNFLIEIPYILILRETLNKAIIRKDDLRLNMFLQLIQNIALLNQNKRDYYQIKSFKIRVLLAHPLDLKLLLSLGNKLFKNLFRVQINYDEQEENFIELYLRRINVLKDDSEVNFFQRIQDFEGYK